MKQLTLQEQRARAPLGLFHDWQDRVPVRQRNNLPEEDDAVHRFADLVAALETLLDVHNAATVDEDPCGCAQCRETEGVLFTLRFLQSAFGCGLLVPAKENAVLLAELQGYMASHGDEPADPEPAAVAVALSKPTDTRPHYYWQPQQD